MTTENKQNRIQKQKELWDAFLKRWPIEKLKELTRGKKVNAEVIAEFIDNLELPQSAKDQLKQLSPQAYIGDAIRLVDQLLGE